MVKSGVALYQKINITGSNIYVENFTLVSKVTQGWYYAALLIELILLISVCSIRIVVIGVCFIRISFTKMPQSGC